MQVGDLVRHTGWQEKGLIIKKLRRRTPSQGGIYEVLVIGRTHHSHWVGRDMEVISERR